MGRFLILLTATLTFPVAAAAQQPLSAHTLIGTVTDIVRARASGRDG